MDSKSSSFELLNEHIQKWIWRQGWNSLKDIQENSIPIILKGDCDVIISAATAGGKTEAAFLPILSRIIQDERQEGYQVLYISPLKALINDQYRRLSEMTIDLGINVIPWHGDIDASRKQKSLKNPNGIIIITPESLESFFINRKQYAKQAFSSLKYIVIDELHSFIGTERGKQLQSLLSRIELITQRAVPRIAMSATFSDYAIVRQFLRIDTTFPCRIPPQGESNHEIKILIKEYVPAKEYDPENDIAKELYVKLRGSNNLVFANSRVSTENYAVALSDMCVQNGVPNEFRVHHGSLSKTERENVERELQKGEFPITALCTSTLELGVDIGKVKSITQIGSAPSVASLRQRLGRSGRRNEPSILRIFSIENLNNPFLYDLRANLVQNIAVIELLKEKQYENPDLKSYHFSTLIQQILAIIAQYGAFNPKDGWRILCSIGAFRNVTPSIFLELLKSLGEKDVITQLHNGHIVVGLNGENILHKKDFYVAFVSTNDFTVINKYNSKRLGVIQYTPQAGDLIVISARRWLVESIDLSTKNIYVSLIKHGGSAMFGGDSAEIDHIITERMKKIYLSDESYAYLDRPSKSNEQLDSGRVFFRKNLLTKSPFITYGSENIFVTWSGAKINRTISLIAKLCLDRNIHYDYILLRNISETDVKAMLNKGKPSSEQLAMLIGRPGKIRQKYDSLLSDHLLNIEYASTYLDVDGAWSVLTQE
jgi:ATP-dependent helicase Lhr and Lhr-like helicase